MADHSQPLISNIQWVLFTERHPTVEDADKFGKCLAMFSDGSVVSVHLNDLDDWLPIAWLDIKTLPQLPIE